MSTENLIQTLYSTLRHEKNRWIIVIRHGERADQYAVKLHQKNMLTADYMSWLNLHPRYDPPITSSGSTFIREETKHFPFNDPIIISSPFLRCIQTSQVILDKIPTELYLHSGLSEWFNDSCGIKDQIPLPTYLTKFKFLYHDFAPQYKETKDNMCIRFIHTFFHIFSQFPTNDLIIVTHQPGVDIFKNWILKDCPEFTTGVGAYVIVHQQKKKFITQCYCKGQNNSKLVPIINNEPVLIEEEEVLDTDK